MRPGDAGVAERPRLQLAPHVDQLVRPGSGGQPALPPFPFDQDLHLSSHQRAVLLERDLLLNRDQSIEPLLHHGLGELAGEGDGRRPRPG